MSPAVTDVEMIPRRVTRAERIADDIHLFELRDPAGGELVDYLEASRQRPGVVPGAALWVSWEPGAARLLHIDD